MPIDITGQEQLEEEPEVSESYSERLVAEYIKEHPEILKEHPDFFIPRVRRAAMELKQSKLVPTFGPKEQEENPEQVVFPQQPPMVQQPAPAMPQGYGIPGTRGLESAIAGAQRAYEEAPKEAKKALQAKRAAIWESAETEMDIAKATAAVLGERQASLEGLEAKRQAREQERQSYVIGEMRKVKDTIDTLRKTQIDPYRFYRHPDGSRDLPKSIMSAVAIGLGALGSSLPARYGGTGGPNVALQIIDKAIDRDIAAQRDDLNNRQAGVGLQMNLLGQMKSQFADERQAEAAARAVMLETARFKIEEASAKSGDRRVADNAALMAADIDVMEQKIAGEFKVRAAEQFVAGQEKLLAARRTGAVMQAQTQQAQMAAAQPVPAPSGWVATRPQGKGEFEEARKITDATETAISAYNDLIAHLEDPEKGPSVGPAWGGKATGELEEKYENLVLAIKAKVGRGVSVETIKDMLPSKTGYGNAVARLKVARDAEQADLVRQMGSRGFAPQAGGGGVLGETPVPGVTKGSL